MILTDNSELTVQLRRHLVTTQVLHHLTYTRAHSRLKFNNQHMDRYKLQINTYSTSVWPLTLVHPALFWIHVATPQQQSFLLRASSISTEPLWYIIQTCPTHSWSAVEPPSTVFAVKYTHDPSVSHVQVSYDWLIEHGFTSAPTQYS